MNTFRTRSNMLRSRIEAELVKTAPDVLARVLRVPASQDFVEHFKIVISHDRPCQIYPRHTEPSRMTMVATNMPVSIITDVPSHRGA